MMQKWGGGHGAEVVNDRLPISCQRKKSNNSNLSTTMMNRRLMIYELSLAPGRFHTKFAFGSLLHILYIMMMQNPGV